MFTKLEQRAWIKIGVARGRSTQECFQGLREACGDTCWYWAPSFFMTMQGVTPLLLSWISCVDGSGRFWNNHRTHPMSPCDYYLFANVKVPLRGDPIQHKRLTYPYCSAVNTEHQQRWTRWWLRRLPKISQKVVNKGGATILKIHKCRTPVNEGTSEISNCWHYFWSNACIT